MKVGKEEKILLGVYDLSHYSLAEVRTMARSSFGALKGGKLERKVVELTKGYGRKFPKLNFISAEYRIAFQQYKTHLRWKSKKAQSLKRITSGDVQYFSKLMSNKTTKNLYQVKTTVLMNRRF